MVPLFGNNVEMSLDEAIGSPTFDVVKVSTSDGDLMVDAINEFHGHKVIDYFSVPPSKNFNAISNNDRNRSLLTLTLTELVPSSKIEIVHVISISNLVGNYGILCFRGSEGSTAQSAWAMGDIVSMRMTSFGLSNMMSEAGQLPMIDETGNLLIDSSGAILTESPWRA